MSSENRSDAAIRIAKSGGAVALDYYRKLDTLAIEHKGHQDFVTIADQNTETHIRALIADAFPDDGIVGEEHAPKPSQTGYTWVIDPIDGTSNFINGIPQWCVIIAVVKGDQTEIGVTFDPVHDETFAATRGQGATFNGRPMVCPADSSIRNGTIATGFNNRLSPQGVIRLIDAIIDAKGVFSRNGSGGLSLAYVAAGRYLAYAEEHMNAWDCLAGQLQIAEAGGQIEDQPATEMIAQGGRVIAGSTGVFDALLTMADTAFDASKSTSRKT